MAKFNGLKASVTSVAHGNEHHEVYYITPCGDEFKLHVEPEYRRNGTQSHDGFFPRYYKELRFAKGTATRYLGERLNWENIEI